MKRNKKKKKKLQDFEDKATELAPLKVGQVVKRIVGKGKNREVWFHTVEDSVETVQGGWLYHLNNMPPGTYINEANIKKLTKTERGK